MNKSINQNWRGNSSQNEDLLDNNKDVKNTPVVNINQSFSVITNQTNSY